MSSEAVEEFFEAIRNDDASALARLLRREPGLARAADDAGKTGLHWAAELDRFDAARALIEAGADIEARASWGDTPLDWAATMGSLRVGNALLSHGARGMNLVVAAGLGNLGHVSAILDSGASLADHRRRGVPAAPDETWPAETAAMQGDPLSDALVAAARNGHEEVVLRLLDHGADVDARGVFGGTGLHWAAINGHRGTVELLLDRGASPRIHDVRFDATPAGWAREGGHHDLVEVLHTARTGADARGARKLEGPREP